MSKSAVNKNVRVYITFRHGSVHGGFAGDVIDLPADIAEKVVKAGHGVVVVEDPDVSSGDLGLPGSESVATSDQPGVGEGGSSETAGDSEG